jgi:carbon starvation protein
MNRRKYVLFAAIPGVFMAFITFWAGYLQVVQGYLPKGQYVLAVLAITAMSLMIIVFIGTFKKWVHLAQKKDLVKDEYGELVKEVVER